MKTFKAYPKVQALHKPESDGILQGTCYIQEKVDGANASIWLEEDGIHCGSRSRDLTKAQDDFNGFVSYVKKHEGIQNFFKDYPESRLCGEWLVRHTIGYNELAYKQFYVFDIEQPDDTYLSIEEVNTIADGYDIQRVHLFDKIENPTLEQIKRFAGTSVLGSKGEGVVIKNMDFVNRFGDKTYSKHVTQDFKEDNAITFGGNNKSSEKYNEMYYVNKYLTLSRVQKIFHKLESSEGRLDMKHIPRIMSSVYHDLIQEEAWSIATEMAKEKKMFDFQAFQKFCYDKSKKIFIEILTGDISVAHKTK